MNTNYLIFIALLQRDLKITFSNIKSIIIDSVILAAIYSILFGGLMPSLGMNNKFSGPLFIGSFILSMISMAFSRTVKLKSDLEFSRFIDYHITLPISKKWLLFEYIISFSIDILVGSLPIFFIGLIALAKLLTFKINILGFLLMLIFSSILISTLFLILTFATEWQWFLNNTWERILAPLMHFGGLYFVWQQLNNFSPVLSNLAFLSPILFIVEGLRNSLFGSENYLSLTLCLTIVLIWTVVMLIILSHSINKRLDLIK